MPEELSVEWQSAFWQCVQRYEHAVPLREAALQEKLGDWTRELTSVVVETCESVGWRASAKGHALDLLPVVRSEYLAMDVIAFPEGQQRWRFPVAAMELENSHADDRVAYSLWKVLCVRAGLRVVFCYRRDPEEGAGLVRFLRDEVVRALSIRERTQIEGNTLVVVGLRGEASTFPYGFFKWWQLERSTGSFRVI